MKYIPMIFVMVVMTVTILYISKQDKDYEESLLDSFSNAAKLANNFNKAYILLDSSSLKMNQSSNVAVVIANSGNTPHRNSEIQKYNKLFAESDSLRKASIAIFYNSYVVFQKSAAKHKEKFGY